MSQYEVPVGCGISRVQLGELQESLLNSIEIIGNRLEELRAKQTSPVLPPVSVPVSKVVINVLSCTYTCVGCLLGCT